MILKDEFVFAFGPTPDGSRLAVVRLGGHIMDDESWIQCVTREISEEADIIPELINPVSTYWHESGSAHDNLVQVDLNGKSGSAATFLVTSTKRNYERRAALTYLAVARENPQPFAETVGIIFLGHSQVLNLCANPVSLDEFLSQGGRMMLRGSVDSSLVLTPFLQLRLLPELLRNEEMMFRDLGVAS